MKKTTHLELNKPELTDYVNVEDLNENADIIDEAINENKEGLAAHLADLASQEVGKGADMIGLPDPNNMFDATNIGGAMNELFTNVSDGKSLVGGAITDVDEKVVIPAEPTFQQLADAIGQINTGKKWASGKYTTTGVGKEFVELTNPKYTLPFVEVSGLDFKPSTVMLFGGDEPLYSKSYTSALMQRGGSQMAYSYQTSSNQAYIFIRGNAYLRDGGFCIPFLDSHVVVQEYSWLAYE